MYKVLISLILCILSFSSLADINKSHGYAIYSNLKYPANFSQFDYVNPNAPKGGVFKQAHIGTFNAVNANILKGTKAPGLDYIYDSLMVKSMDELNSYYCLVAESLEYPDDLSYVIFNLRKEARWHDSSPITADDLLFSFYTLRDKGDPNFKILLDDVKKVEKLNNYRVKYTFKGTNEPLQIALIGELPIIQKFFFKDKVFEQFEEIYPTSGPYRIKSYTYGKNIQYERVKNYWAKDLPVYKGMYNFDILEYDCYQEMTIAVEAFKAGAYDYREENSAQIWATAYEGKMFKENKIIKENRKHKLPANLQTYFLNLRKPELTDPALRKAIYLAYDFDWMNQNLYYSIYTRIKSYFDNTEFASSGIPSGSELEALQEFKSDLPPELFTEEFSVPSTNSDPLKNRQYLKMAMQTLLDSGYKIEGEMLISPITNNPVELELIYYFQAYEKTILAFKENLAKIGITLIPRLADYAQYLLRTENFQYDIITGAFAAITFPGLNQVQFWHSDSDVKGGYNLSGIRSKVVDSLLNKLVKAQTKEKVITYARALDRVLLWNYYTVPQMYSGSYRSVYWDKFNMPKIRTEYAVGIETWWIKQ